MRLVGEGRALAPKALIACGGKDHLTAEGSTAQQNAMLLFNQAWGKFCPGKGVSYTPTGAVKSFLAMAAGNGQTALSSAGYVPLPDNVKERLVRAIDAMQ